MKLSSKEVEKAIINAVKKHNPSSHYRVFLFGSRVSGKETNRSDFDVGYESDEPLPTKNLFGITDEIDEIPILQKIEFVDFSTVSEDFKKIAKENMKVLYEQ